MTIIQNLKDKIKETETRIHFLQLRLEDLNNELWLARKEFNLKRRKTK